MKDDEVERDLPRLSIVRTPVDADGIIVEGVDLEFPSVPNDPAQPVTQIRR